MTQDRRFGSLFETIQKTLTEAFQLGVAAGYDEVRKSVLNAVDTPSVETPAQPARPKRKFPKRAPRGTVSKFLHNALSRRPGQTWGELREASTRAPVRFSYLSISNELHRQRGVKYHEDEENRWFLAEDSQDRQRAA